MTELQVLITCQLSLYFWIPTRCSRNIKFWIWSRRFYRSASFVRILYDYFEQHLGLDDILHLQFAKSHGSVYGRMATSYPLLLISSTIETGPLADMRFWSAHQQYSAKISSVNLHLSFSSPCCSFLRVKNQPDIVCSRDGSVSRRWEGSIVEVVCYRLFVMAALFRLVLVPVRRSGFFSQDRS